jgi:hypothetical protein
MYGVLSNSGINNATGLWKKQTLVHPAANGGCEPGADATVAVLKTIPKETEEVNGAVI